MNSRECQHVAIIMDGNGRWAKKQGKPRTAGHLVGSDNVRTIAIAANELGVKYLTIFAFSTENWKRSQEEVSYLMGLPDIFFKKYMKEFIQRGYRIHMIGDLDELPTGTRNVLREAEEESKTNDNPRSQTGGKKLHLFLKEALNRRGSFSPFRQRQV